MGNQLILLRNFSISGCDSELTLSTPDVCGLEKDRGEGRNFTTKWFFDMEYGGCSRYHQNTISKALKAF